MFSWHIFPFLAILSILWKRFFLGLMTPKTPYRKTMPQIMFSQHIFPFQAILSVLRKQFWTNNISSLSLPKGNWNHFHLKARDFKTRSFEKVYFHSYKLHRLTQAHLNTYGNFPSILKLAVRDFISYCSMKESDFRWITYNIFNFTIATNWQGRKQFLSLKNW